MTNLDIRAVVFIFLILNQTVLTSFFKGKGLEMDLFDNLDDFDELQSISPVKSKRKFEYRDSMDEETSNRSSSKSARSNDFTYGNVEKCFDIRSFDSLLAEINIRNDFDSFKSLFLEYSSKYPQNCNEIISSIISLKNLKWIIYLYENDYDLEAVMTTRQLRSIISSAIESENFELLEYMLNDISDPIGYCKRNNIPLSAEMRKFFTESRNSTRNLSIINTRDDEKFNEKLVNFRRMFIRNYVQNSRLIIITDRANVFAASFKLISENSRMWSDCNLQVFIAFEGEVGHDFGGLTREWIEQMLESFMTEDSSRIVEIGQKSFANWNASSSNAIYDLSASSGSSSYKRTVNLTEAIFIQNTNGVYVPNTKYSPEIFEFIGSIFALAFVFDIPIAVEFIPALYYKLASDSCEEEIDYEGDLKLIDPGMQKGLRKLKDNDADLKHLDIDGSVEDFITAQSKYHTLDIYEGSLNALRNGFVKFLNERNYINLGISAEQLKNTMKGGSFLTSEDFKRHVDTRKLTDSNTKTWIFEIISEFSDEDRLRLFRFITTRRCVPFKGLENLSSPLIFYTVKECPAEMLPFTSTCATTLFIPVYDSKEILKAKLLQSITECDTFDLQ